MFLFFLLIDIYLDSICFYFVYIQGWTIDEVAVVTKEVDHGKMDIFKIYRVKMSFSSFLAVKCKHECDCKRASWKSFAFFWNPNRKKPINKIAFVYKLYSKYYYFTQPKIISRINFAVMRQLMLSCFYSFMLLPLRFRRK